MEIDQFQCSVIFHRIDPAATDNIGRMFEIWKNVDANSNSETVRYKTTFLTIKLRTIADIILASKPEDKNKINVKLMEYLL